ncbi:MAG: TMEM165/GDT1 family protein [Amphritea sp.]
MDFLWLEGSAVLTAFLLVFLAEFGDKSQLVCMTLAARHKSLPVLLGAVFSFALLNLIAVTLGATAAAWLPLGSWYL